MTTLRKKYVRLLRKIPPRHYWSIFVFLSLYFVVPYSEITVTVAAILYYKFERNISPFIQKITSRIPDWIRFGGSFLFFLVMINDTLLYVVLIAAAFWSRKQVLQDEKERATINE
ncbi:MAG: hypothetical protein CM15mV4_1430 [Caudoviricetes sp.]|nr:MAG: hypothetical protein CM15mV4_1430 [Caudoviricetes sp.]